MAKFDKIAVLNKIGSTGMVPVFYHEDVEIVNLALKLWQQSQNKYNHVKKVEFVLLSLPIGGTLPRKYLPGL